MMPPIPGFDKAKELLQKRGVRILAEQKVAGSSPGPP
jgi:hypothetical protein